MYSFIVHHNKFLSLIVVYKQWYILLRELYRKVRIYVPAADYWNIYHTYVYMLVCIPTYESIKTANATTSKIIPLMNTPFLMSLLHCDFEVNCGLNADCIVDNVGIYIEMMILLT